MLAHVDHMLALCWPKLALSWRYVAAWCWQFCQIIFEKLQFVFFWSGASPEPWTLSHIKCMVFPNCQNLIREHRSAQAQEDTMLLCALGKAHRCIVVAFFGSLVWILGMANHRKKKFDLIVHGHSQKKNSKNARQWNQTVWTPKHVSSILEIANKFWFDLISFFFFYYI